MDTYRYFLVLLTVLQCEAQFIDHLFPTERTTERTDNARRVAKASTPLVADNETRFEDSERLPYGLIPPGYTVSSMMSYGKREREVFILLRRVDLNKSLRNFDDQGQYNRRAASAIPINNVIRYNVTRAKRISSFGANVFHYPNSITTDPHGNFWYADTARKQVLQMNQNETSPSQTVGALFGSDELNNNYKICGPTSVAVTSNRIYVTEGYCARRVLMYDRQGVYIAEFQISNGFNRVSNPFKVHVSYTPVSLAVDVAKNRLLVAVNGDGDGYSKISIVNAGLTYRTRAVFGNLIRDIVNDDVYAFHTISQHPTHPTVFGISAYNYMLGHRGFSFNTDDATFSGCWTQDQWGFYNPKGMAMTQTGSLIYVIDKADQYWQIHTFSHCAANRSRRSMFANQLANQLDNQLDNNYKLKGDRNRLNELDRLNQRLQNFLRPAQALKGYIRPVPIQTTMNRVKGRSAKQTLFH